jgi:hypothetical protein
MSRTRNTDPEVTRDALEGFIWSATGWRGDPAVIDSILERVDRYTAGRIARELRNAARELADEREAKQDAITAVAELTRRLVAAESAVAVVSAPVVDRVRVGELLELLAVVSGEVSTALSVSTRTVNAVHALSSALRAADGGVKAIELSDGARERLYDAELAERINDAVSRAMTTTVAPMLSGLYDESDPEQSAVEPDALNEASRPAPEYPVIGPDADEDPQSAIAAFDAALEAGEAVEIVISPDPAVEAVPDEAREAEIAERHDTDVVTGDPLVNVVVETNEPDPITEMVAEAQQEAITDGDAKRCTRCERVLPMTEFHRDNRALDGHKGSCRSCDSQRAKLRAQTQAAQKAFQGGQ